MRKPVALFHACIAGLVISALLGCRKQPPDFHIKLEAPGSGVFTKYKLTVDGAEMGAFSSTQAHEFTVRGHSGDDPREMLPRMDASVLYVCGWQAAKVDLQPPSRYAVEQADKEKRSVPLTMYLDFRPSWQDVTVLVDNHGGPAARLAVGEYEQPVAADEAGRISFPYWPHCDEARQLRLNGETIGNLEEEPTLPGTARAMLLDISGSHCFRHEWRTYSNFPEFGGSGHQIFEAQRLRALSGPINYFLQPLLSVEYSTESVVQKSSLNEVPCK